MNRSIATILLLALLSGCSMLKHRATATIVDEASAHTPNLTDTLNMTESGFNRRVTESLSALTHYLRSATSASDSVARAYYSGKVLRLFHPESRIYIAYDNGTACDMPADSFCRIVSRGDVAILSVDSVDIPLWNRALLSRRDSLVMARSGMWSYSADRCTHEVTRHIPLQLEFTEDGPERVIVFGNAYMSCRSNTTDTETAKQSASRTYSAPATPQSPGELPWYDCRIKLVDEFFDRFNGKELRSDIVADSSDVRLANMMLLFNADMFASADDPIFQAAKDMAQQIIYQDIRINYSDTLWTARAECQARYKGTPARITLYLKVEQRKTDMYKWVIAGAEGECLTLPADRMPEKLMILPDAHETDFMALHDITTGRDDYITAYAARSVHPDPTSVFFALVYAGVLDIEYVDDLSFIFCQVPGYRFTIRNFERDSYNCGWLIDSFEKITD